MSEPCKQCHHVKMVVTNYVNMSIFGMLGMQCSRCGTVWIRETNTSEVYSRPDWPTEEERGALIERRMRELEWGPYRAPERQEKPL